MIYPSISSYSFYEQLVDQQRIVDLVKRSIFIDIYPLFKRQQDIINAQNTMNFPIASESSPDAQRNFSIQQSNLYSTTIDIDGLLDQFIDPDIWKDKGGSAVSQDYRQFQENLVIQIQKDLQSLSICHKESMKQKIENQDESSSRSFRESIVNQIHQQMNRPIKESKNLKLLEESAQNSRIQLNENLFVRKYFGSHLIMNKQMTEAGRYMFIQHQYFITTYPKFKQAQDQRDQEKFHALNDFYNMRMSEFEAILPQEKEQLLKKILPQKVPLSKKNTVKLTYVIYQINMMYNHDQMINLMTF